MKKLNINLIYLIAFNLILLKSLFSQAQQGHTNQNKFRQLYDEFAEPNKYHNNIGRFPGGGLGNQNQSRTIAHSPP